MSEHSGKTAIVTGASTGIGRASAEALAAAGFTVFGTSRKATGNGANRVSMLTCDVTDDQSVNALVSTVLAETGRVESWSTTPGSACWAAPRSPRSARFRPCSTSTCSASCA